MGSGEEDSRPLRRDFSFENEDFKNVPCPVDLSGNLFPRRQDPFHLVIQEEIDVFFLETVHFSKDDRHLPAPELLEYFFFLVLAYLLDDHLFCSLRRDPGDILRIHRHQPFVPFLRIRFRLQSLLQSYLPLSVLHFFPDCFFRKSLYPHVLPVEPHVIVQGFLMMFFERFDHCFLDEGDQFLFGYALLVLDLLEGRKEFLVFHLFLFCSLFPRGSFSLPSRISLQAIVSIPAPVSRISPFPSTPLIFPSRSVPSLRKTNVSFPCLKRNSFGVRSGRSRPGDETSST